MAMLLRKIWDSYQFLFEELPDPRMKPLPFMARPYQVLTLLAVYLLFVLKWGPKWMEKRPAYNLDKVLMVYNVGQVLACFYTLVGSIYYAWGWNYKWICEPVDYSNKYESIQITHLTYFYFILKVLDLFDTIFFVLRKKFNQVSFLHLYHHTGMVLLIWGANTYMPGGHGTFIGVINSFVHMVMYTYYFLTVINPSYKQSIWWKKHITQLQILQFAWCVVHMSTIVFKPDCEYPRWTSAVFLPQNIFMLVLFVDFYIKTYIKKPKAAVEVKTDTNDDKTDLKLNDKNVEDIKELNEANGNLLEDKCKEHLSSAVLRVTQRDVLKPNGDNSFKEDNFKNGKFK